VKSWGNCDCIIRPTEMLDKLQEKVGKTVGDLADPCGSLKLARRLFLDEVTNERDRAVYEVLISFITQKPSKRGFRSGNRAGRVTERDKYLIEDHAKWLANHPKGSDRQFAMEEYEWERQVGEFVGKPLGPKVPTEADIRRITKLLRDARRRVERQ